MRIKVFTNHFVYMTPEPGKPPTVQYDFGQEFIFIFENNILKLDQSSWYKPANNLEDCFKYIKGYFSGTNFNIRDILPMST